MIKILFVDDEPNVLEGLQRLLRPMRNEWYTQYVESGTDALELLEQSEFDVVVSDVKMPEIDGVELLSEVRTRYPSIIRIALSGHSDRQSIIRSLASTHRFLSKPCDPETLKSAITAACALRAMLGNDNLRTIVSGMDVLPSPAGVSQQLNRELASPEISISRIAMIIGKDPAIAAKILQMANSAFFGVRNKVSSLSQAVSVLGIDSVKMLLSVTEIFSVFNSDISNKANTINIYEHSLRVGNLVRELAKAEGLPAHSLEDAVAAGLLHDIGKLVLAWKSSAKFAKYNSMMKQEQLSCCEAENLVFGTTHAEVGAYLLGLWGLPEIVVEVLAFHHTPSLSGGSVISPLTVVHFANAYDYMNDKTTLESNLDMEYLSNPAFVDKIPYWKSICDEASGSGLSKSA